ncbi:polyketide cyclase / dehydrase and lipid transport [Leptolyngbya sp. 'hensonii']|uniref:polyketide cyclase / dehydrase and lipid transport n=1 Tax=Leptolyngbya sp. 'hensonii' TaxID=1922337 RepID=UPI00094F684D|nr:polyketide cyclase / dehydrase and lipid transport [Leptolyngbya sp. 'hensonii']OLP19604.1 polyketide cyclase / dehydrase and lipid transport [Leptolyngbya sp. 'hensonii']
MLNFLSGKLIRRQKRWFQCSLARTYGVLSSASVDDLWKKIVDLADVSWHPLLSSTNVPRGLEVKPGLIYQAVTRLSPIPVRIFVELVRPMEVMSVRIIAMPGIEERVTYKVESTVLGTCVSYSVTLNGWLTPLIWSFLQPYAARVASELAQATEQAVAGKVKVLKDGCFDF